MEGLYFFGEHVRWNLGWNNPNQAGAFVAMLIPWLWGLGRMAGGGSRKANGLFVLWLAVELGLWFLLCKTYSRGALVAVSLAGVMFFVWKWYLSAKWSNVGWLALRLLGIVSLLLATGFFARIDPGYVSQDASAGNRLTLWKGGLQMIAAAPWQGWGKGQSGSGFMHWFQPLDAKEAYAGMVNSYLHVGVEYGLPVLVMVMALASALVVISFALPWVVRITERNERWLLSLAVCAGASIITFLIANIFSTLWIFKNLWWVPGISGLLIFSIGFLLMGKRFVRTGGIVLATMIFVSTLGAIVLFSIGKSFRGEVKIELATGRDVIVGRGNMKKRGEVLFFPATSVLGETWGKEIRRMAMAGEFREMEVRVNHEPPASKAPRQSQAPKLIVACGNQASAGLAALSRFPEATLILVHPLGKIVGAESIGGKVVVLLPMLDTQGEGRNWRMICKKRGWRYSISPGVAQDVRLIWPDVIVSSWEPN